MMRADMHRRICLWKIGQEPLSSHPAYREGLAHTSPLGFGLAATFVIRCPASERDPTDAM